MMEVSSSTVEEEKTVVPPFVEASTVSPLLGAASTETPLWRSHRPVVWSERLECR